MDSLYVRKIINLQTTSDSLLNRTNDIVSTLSKLESESFYSKIIIPLLVVVMTSILSFFIQYLLKNRELKISKDNDLKLLKNSIISNLTLMKFSLAELAYLEIDLRYQYYISIIGETEVDRLKAREEHYNDYKYISDNRQKLADSYSQIIVAFYSFYRISNISMPNELLNSLNELSNNIVKLPTPQHYDTSRVGKKEITDSEIKNDILNLTTEYQKYSDEVCKIQAQYLII